MKLDKIEAIIAIISFIVTLIYSMIKFLVNQLNKKIRFSQRRDSSCN